MKRFIILAALLVSTAMGSLLFAQEAQTQSADTAAVAENTAQWKYIAAALAVGIACIAGGIAVGQIGAAAMGGHERNPELSGKALPYAGLAEGICLWGFLVALFILLI